MAYQPATSDPTVINGQPIQLTAAATLTLGREHEVSGAAAVALTLPTGTRSGSRASVKVDESYTGSGVTVSSVLGSSFAMTAGQQNTFVWNGTQYFPE